MKYFIFSGIDTSADTGSWYLVIKAGHAWEATRIAEGVRKKRGRSDLVLGEPRELDDIGMAHGVIATNIETR